MLPFLICVFTGSLGNKMLLKFSTENSDYIHLTFSLNLKKTRSDQIYFITYSFESKESSVYC